ncbi:hypothetical protein SAMD00019534_045730 [Acytostelium subglobosum LB1]|uniref:hypothetical protein n=1 Tax=Acytostelium subglobosum LB1 TaxID=1410327 RepID=UPI000644E926|nr:hypothetical protein SAMD00019534_045730 [Acytostelium subglobosum LB1]GAM21398.1 hypothetical protein SAMD00019534_045730 [Acytostelium subglobosum LB1]|eukprot:XP_012755517.1 hypothetical protein SAMD00019534_045730 [Acytostelium subglobosum LB1]
MLDVNKLLGSFLVLLSLATSLLVVYSMTKPCVINKDGGALYDIYVQFGWFSYGTYYAVNMEQIDHSTYSGSAMEWTMLTSFIVLCISMAPSFALAFITVLFIFVDKLSESKRRRLAQLLIIVSTASFGLLTTGFLIYLTLTASLRNDNFHNCHHQFFCRSFRGTQGNFSWGPMDGYWLCLMGILGSFITALVSIIVHQVYKVGSSSSSNNSYQAVAKHSSVN